MPKSDWHQSVLRNYWSLSYLHSKLCSLCCSSNPSYLKRCSFLLQTKANCSTRRFEASSHQFTGSSSYRLLLPCPHNCFHRHFAHCSWLLPCPMWPRQPSKMILQSFRLDHPQQLQIEILASKTWDLRTILGPRCTSTLPYQPTKLDCWGRHKVYQGNVSEFRHHT